MKMRLACAALLLAVAACAAPVATKPAFVESLLGRLSSEPVKNPPAAIWKYRYREREVYYVPPSCCDVPSVVYDADGAQLCSPDGGIIGKGDGKCPDFFDARREGVLVWSDRRAP